jgi:integrase
MKERSLPLPGGCWKLPSIRLHQALPDADSQLLVETAIESGMRWGELTEIRVRDIDFATRILTVSRAVVELTKEDHPDGGRFLAKEYPKDKEYRRFKLSRQIIAKIQAHAAANGLGGDDLVFSYQPPTQSSTRRPALGAVYSLGMTEPNENGRQYRHGTLTAYNAARCRCEYCRGAYAEYRAKLRSGGKDTPRTPRTRDTDGHIPADWFRHQIWNPARKAAGLDGARIHDMRHAHASWLLAGGAAPSARPVRINATSVGSPTYCPESSRCALLQATTIRASAGSAASLTRSSALLSCGRRTLVRLDCVHTITGRIRFSVRVPVLSVQITSVVPSVSTALSRLTTAPRLASARTTTESDSVTTGSSPSGTVPASGRGQSSVPTTEVSRRVTDRRRRIAPCLWHIGEGRRCP